MLTSETYDITLDEDETFSDTETVSVCRDYVCGVCHQELSVLFAEGYHRRLIVCQQHGTVTKCGRVLRSSVSIEMERSHTKYPVVIRNLSDLWGELIPPKRTVEENLKSLGF